jgi:hypothetical protein
MMSDLGVNSAKFIEPLGAAQKIVNNNTLPFSTDNIQRRFDRTLFYLNFFNHLGHPFNSIENSRPSNRRQLTIKFFPSLAGISNEVSGKINSSYGNEGLVPLKEEKQQQPLVIHTNRSRANKGCDKYNCLQHTY